MTEAPSYEFHLTAGDAWNAMYADCEAATHSIQLDQYILRDDEVGKKFLLLFIAKAQQGVRVHLILDLVGSRGLKNSPLIDALVKAGGAVCFYNPLRWYDLFRPHVWFPRNHSKILLVDEKVGYIGSVCFEQNMRFWRDTQLRFTGQLIDQVKQDFEAMWQNGCSLEIRHKRSAVKRVHAGQDVRYVTSKPQFRINPIYRELLNKINIAKDSIYLVTPYFLPTRKLSRALRKASRRGVDVHIMAGEQTDVAVADCVSQSYLPKMIRNKFKVFLYQKPILHAKYAVIDDWAMLGSMNLDYLSLWRNREANLLIDDPELVSALKGHFENDLKDCIEAKAEYWYSRSLFYKALGYVGRSIRRML